MWSPTRNEGRRRRSTRKRSRLRWRRIVAIASAHCVLVALLISAVVEIIIIRCCGCSAAALVLPEPANTGVHPSPPPPLQLKRVSAGPLTLSELGCGSWSWGNRFLWNYSKSQDEELYQAYAFLRNAGVTVFDTADSYGTFDLNGRAELLLGRFERRYLNNIIVGGSHGDSELYDLESGSGVVPQSLPQQVATKLAPYPWRITRASFVRAARASLQRLQHDRLAIAQLHWSTANYQPWQERALWDGLADIYEAGLCDAVGVSNYGPQQLVKIADYLRNERQDVPLATVQIQYSLMTYKTAREMHSVCCGGDQNDDDDDDDNNRAVTKCRIVAYSPLCLGLLSGKYSLDHLPQHGPRKQLFRELLPGAKDLLATLQAIGKEYNDDIKTPSQVAINWALCKGTVPIPGCRTIEQAREVLGSTGWRLESDAVAELDRIALKVKKPMIQNIFQTQ